MSDHTAFHYDVLYEEPEVFGKPMPVFEHLLRHVSKGKVLDIGAGQGRHSVYLAEHGFDVEAVDVSPVGIKVINAKASARRLPIRARVCDIVSEGISDEYDVIVCVLMFHHMREDVAKAALMMIQKHTRPGGLNVIATLTKRSDFFQSDPRTPNWFPKRNELLRSYAGWKNLFYEEKNGTSLQGKTNMCAYIIARKPAT